MQGGIGFFGGLSIFQAYGEYYYLPFDVLYDHYQDSLKDGRKSIAYDTFKQEAFLIKFGFNPKIELFKSHR